MSKSGRPKPWNVFARIKNDKLRSFFRLDMKPKKRRQRVVEKAHKRSRVRLTRRSNKNHRHQLRALHRTRRERGQNQRTGR